MDFYNPKYIKCYVGYQDFFNFFFQKNIISVKTFLYHTTYLQCFVFLAFTIIKLWREWLGQIPPSFFNV